MSKGKTQASNGDVCSHLSAFSPTKTASPIAASNWVPGWHSAEKISYYYLAAACCSLVIISTILAPIWHCPLKVAVGSICNLPAYKFPVTTHSPLNCNNSFARILPETFPTISAWLPGIISPSTTPLPPIIILAAL